VWDFQALAELWETSDTPVRSRLPLEAVGPALAQLYQKMKQLPKGSNALLTPPPDDQEPETGGRPGGNEKRKSLTTTTKPTLSLDDLPVLASATSYWPSPTSPGRADVLPAAGSDSASYDSDDGDDHNTSESQAIAEPATDAEVMDEQGGDPPEGAANQVGENPPKDGESEEETQAMDALLEPASEEQQGTAGL